MDVKEEVKIYGHDFSLSNYHDYHNTFIGKVDNTSFKMDVFVKYEDIEIKEKKKAKELYNSIKGDVAISESDFYRLYNLCKISKREEKLIKDSNY